MYIFNLFIESEPLSIPVKDENVKKALKEIEYLTEDVNTLSQMIDLVVALHCPRGQIEDNLRDMLTAVNKQLTEKHVSESQLSYLELTLNTRYAFKTKHPRIKLIVRQSVHLQKITITTYCRNNIENVSIIFSNPEKRTSWEETFLEAKLRLGKFFLNHFVVSRLVGIRLLYRA